MNVKIDKGTYKEVSINTDNARNISEFNIDDINYFVSLLVNSEVFGEVINLEGGNEE